MSFRKTRRRLALLLLSGFLATSCKDSPEEAVVHQEISEEETAEAIQEACVAPSEETKIEAPDAINNFFRLLAVASRSDNTIDVDRFLSIEGMISSLKSSGLLNSLSKRQINSIDDAMRKAKPQLGTSLQQFAFDSHKIQLVQPINENELLVYVRLYDNELNSVSQVRWWFLKTGSEWRAYDFEELSVGLRTVSLMARMIAGSLNPAASPWIPDFLPVAQALNALDLEEVDSFTAMEEPLKKLRTHGLPTDIRSFASMMMVAVYTAQGLGEEALGELKAAEEGGYTAPIHTYQLASTLADLGKHSEAVLAYEEHMKIFGRDCDTLEMVSDSLLALDRTEEAREAAAEGLVDNPASLNCLISLSAASTPSQIAEESFAAYFAKMPTPEEAFEYTLDYLIEEEKSSQAKGVLKLLKTQFPESELIEYYDEHFEEE